MSFLDIDQIKNDIKKSNKEEIQKQKQQEGKRKEEDNNIWKLTLLNGNKGAAKLRVAPFKDGIKRRNPYIDVPYHYYEKFNHDSNKVEKFYFKCPKFWGEKEDCPYCQANDVFFKARNTERSVKFWAKHEWWLNALILEDISNSNKDNEGKIKLLKFGKQLREVLDKVTTPSEFQDPEKFEPLIYWSPDENGANLNYEAKPQGEHPNYTSSNFDSRSELDVNQYGFKDFKDFINNCFEISYFKEKFDKPTYEQIVKTHQDKFGENLLEIIKPKKVAKVVKMDDLDDEEEDIEDLDSVLDDDEDDDLPF